MRVLVLGSGGREHALAWSIRRSALVDDVLCAPGSDGIGRCARVLPVDLGDRDAVVALARSQSVDLVVVGPEGPLVGGVADALAGAGIAVFGPGAEAAQLEGSKSFANEFMARHRIPTASHRTFDSAADAERYVDAQARPLVVKADGLAAGKGVAVCDDAEQARRAIAEMMRERRFGAAGDRVVIEARLVGEEASFYAISDGERFACLPVAQDYKRVFDGDRGENTGGMGAYSPTPVVDAAVERRIVERIVAPTFEGMRAEGRPYRGVLYVGLMIVDGDPYVIEYNVRFGDPETQALLVRLRSDLVPLLAGAAAGRLPDGGLEVEADGAAVCVVMASEGYPRSSPTDLPIDGLDALDGCDDVVAFHAGTRRRAGRWYTAGGRVLAVTARGGNLRAARDSAYEAVDAIAFKGAHYRGDIAARALGPAGG